MSSVDSENDSDYSPELLFSSSTKKLDLDSNLDPINTTTTTNNNSNNPITNNTTNNLPASLPPIPLGKKVKFAENHTEIPSTDNNDDNDNNINNENSSSSSNSSSTHSSPKSSPKSPLQSPSQLPSPSLSSHSIIETPQSIELFNKLVQFIINNNYISDPSFINKSPIEKTLFTINSYNLANNSNISINDVNLNFNATTSYNKQILKSNDEIQPLIPINPFCRRIDINIQLNDLDLINFQKFKKNNEIYSKEFECINFPSGSRLFIGNLAVNSLKIIDVWKVFMPYGEIMAINLKQGYGFVQFNNSKSCLDAIKGENHVPLHNKFMQLQISKTHEKHTENKDLKDKIIKDLNSNHNRDRDRDRSPTRGNSINTNNKVKVIISIDSDPSFNHLLVNTLNEIGLDCNVKHIEESADNIPQEIISKSAYSGVIATIVSSNSELVNLYLFQRNNIDNAIKFDQYDEISLESAVNFIKERRNLSNNSNNNTREQRDRRNHRDRDRDRDRDNHRERDTRRNRRRNNNNSNNNNNNNNNNSNSNSNRVQYGYSHNQQDVQKHLPPIVPTSYSPYQSVPQSLPQPVVQPPYQQQQYPPPPQVQVQQSIPPYQQQYPPQVQQPPYQPYSNQPYQPYGNSPYQPPQPQPPANQPVASQLVNQLSQLDENSLKAMISLVNNNNNNNNNNNSSAPPQAQPPVQAPSSSSADDDTSKLYETLARLKNNM